MEVEYSKITVEKITKNVFVAKCSILTPLKCEMSMKGHTAEIAKQKLELLLNNKPYSHLDKN